MFIIPLGHDDLFVRRLPFVTIGLVIVCIVVFFATMNTMEKDRKRQLEVVEEIHEFLMSRSYLNIPNGTAKELPDKLRQTSNRSDALGLIGNLNEYEEDLEELDRLFEELESASAGSLLDRFAYTPAEPSLLALITHQFLHGGIFHLLFNMLFLWVAAGKLEDLWTRWVFLGIYLFCGVAGAIAHGLAHPDSYVPLVGASGAVAGLMGAFLVRLTKTKIYFFYLHFLLIKPRWGKFQAPAYFMLPLWFVGEFVSALLFSESEGSGTAYWGHVGGFLAGMVVALILMVTRFEKKTLGREPEVRIKPEDVPLVAFQPPPDQINTFGKPRASIAAPVEAIELKSQAENVRVKIRDIVNLRIVNNAIEAQVVGKAPFQITQDDIKFIAPARIDSISHMRANEIFVSGSAPMEPAFVIVLIGQSTKANFTQVIQGFIIDASMLQWSKLMKTTLDGKQKNFAAFTKILLNLYPKARYVTGPGPMGEHNIPIYLDIDELQNHIRKFTQGDK